MWLKLLVATPLALGTVYAAASAYGAARWQASTQEIRARLDERPSPVGPERVDFGELAGLPAPVQRYFRAVLRDGQPVVLGAHIRHEGTFNMSETAEQWKPFTSEQWVTVQRPGFVWNGRVAMLPGAPVRVHDAYVAGEGFLHASLLGLIPVADVRGGAAMAEGELMRYLAEAVWYPTALLPSQGVTWEPAGDRSAVATLRDGGTSVALLFAFDDRNLIHSVQADSRGRTVGGRTVPTPWRGRFWGYEERGGMRVPLDGEVAWLPPDGERPYWRGHITDLEYESSR